MNTAARIPTSGLNGDIVASESVRVGAADSPFLTTREAAKRCRATPRTIQRWVAAGRLTPDGAHPSGSWLFRRETLDGFLSVTAHRMLADARSRQLACGVETGGHHDPEDTA